MLLLFFLAARVLALVSASSSDFDHIQVLTKPDRAYLVDAPHVAASESAPSLRENRELVQATSAADVQAYLTAHNEQRASAIPVPVPALVPLSWSSFMESEAQWLADQCSWGHQVRGSYGQNLAGSIGYEPDPAGVVNGWADEKVNYDYVTNTCTAVCGHYTQVVWADTTEVGCVKKLCTTGSPFPASYGPNWWIVVCNYSPPGNYIGQRPYASSPVSSPSTKPTGKPTRIPSSVQPTTSTRIPSSAATRIPTTATPTSRLPSAKPTGKPTRKPRTKKPTRKPTV